MEIKKNVFFDDEEEQLYLHVTARLEDIDEEFCDVLKYFVSKEGFEFGACRHIEKNEVLNTKDITIEKNFAIDTIEEAQNAYAWYKQKINELIYQAKEFLSQLEEL